jgi:glycyl-tRNA synthetase
MNENLYNVNGLVFWDEKEIWLRQTFISYFAEEMERYLRNENNAWRMFRIEAPVLMPKEFLNPEYNLADVFGTSRDLILRPETTAGSYLYAKYLLEHHTGVKPPICVWQAGKSFRLEQDQVTKNMRLKEFYQQEFQCIYAMNTKNPYDNIETCVKTFIWDAVNRPCRVVASDRTPAYSTKTMDVMVDFIDENGEAREMELCSISRRTDLEGFNVLEVAIGLDRCIWVKQNAQIN